MPRVAHYVSLISGFLVMPLPFIMIFSPGSGVGLSILVVLILSTFFAGLVMLWAAFSLGIEEEKEPRFQAIVLLMSVVALTGVIASGIFVNLWTFSGPLLGLVASLSFFVGRRISFFW